MSRSEPHQVNGGPQAAPPAAGGEAAQNPLSMLRLINVVLQHRRLVVGLPVLAFVVAFGLTRLLQEREYVSTSRIMPQSPGGGFSSGMLPTQLLAGVAGGPAGGESPFFYASLLRSVEILKDAGATRYARVNERGDSVYASLAEHYGVEWATTPEAQQGASASIIGERVGVNVDRATGLIVVETSARWPEVAVQINRRLIELLNVFNLETRQSQARAEREFAEMRLAEATRELQAAEAALVRFLETNRRVDQIPQLKAQADQLQRQIAQKQTVHNTLAAKYESARLDEVRNTPVITIVGRPENSVSRVRSMALPNGIRFAFAFGALAVLIALAIEYLRTQQRYNPRQFGEFERLSRAAASELRPIRVWGTLRRRLPGGARTPPRLPVEAGTLDDK